MTGIGNPEFHSRQMMQGWGMSLLLHLGLLLAVITVTPRMTIVLEQEPFKWDVTLVEAPQAIVNDEIPPPPPKVQPSTKRPVDPVKQIEPAQEMVARVAPQQSQQIIHPVIEPPKPQQKPDPLETPVETKVPEPVTKDVVKEPVKESVPEPPSVVEPVAPTYTYTAPAPEPPVVASAPPAAEPPVPAAPSPAAPRAVEEVLSPAVSAPPAQLAAEPQTQVAKLAPQAAPPASETKADHRWVGESLHRRVSELKRYPSSARMNGLEGRVLLKAIIRADGHLADVFVLKSSGHAVLDAAAMEVVKMACPLHMKHPIGPPQIAISLPIVYSLAN